MPVQYAVRMEHVDGLNYYQESFPLWVARDGVCTVCDWHTHAFVELAIVVAGHGVHETPDAAFAISAGDVFLVAGTEPHGYRDCEQLSLVNVIYDPATLDFPFLYLAKHPGYQALFVVEPQYRERHSTLHHLRVSMHELSQVTVILDNLEEELVRQSAGFEAAAIVQFTSLLLFLARAYQHQVSACSPNILRLGKVLSLLESRFTEKLTVTELAEVANLSLSHFERIFTETMGLAPMEYVIHLRMNKAEKLLRSTPMPITEVAYQVGYGDSNFFTRQFKKTFQCTPQQYRRSAGGGVGR